MIVADSRYESADLRSAWSWRFGQFELDRSTRELRKNGLRLRLQEQPERILEALLERPGELVLREELRERLWPANTFVDFERSLNAAVAKLRQVLVDSAERPRYLETVPRRGYRFIAPVEYYAIAEEAADLSSTGAGDRISSRRPGRWVPAAAGILVLVVASLSLLHVTPRVSSDNTPAARFVIPPPEGTTIHPMSAVSPDGRKLAFVAIDRSDRRTLWLRELASETAIRMENTDDAVMPFFSPDSQSIAFFAGGKLKRIPVSGGAPQFLCDVSQPAGRYMEPRQCRSLFTVGTAVSSVRVGRRTRTVGARGGGRRNEYRHVAPVPAGWTTVHRLYSGP